MALTLTALAASAANALPASAPAERATPVGVGETAPGFTLVDHEGKTVQFSPGSEPTPTVLVFYRGSWCPFCVKQLSELRSLLDGGDDVRVLAISIDDPDSSAKLAKKLGGDGKGSVAYRLLSDPGHKTIDAYGIRNKQHDGQEGEGIPHPSVFVVDTKGVVRWSRVEEDYKQRPTNAEIRAALGALGS
jgi:peroxiredoxin